MAAKGFTRIPTIDGENLSIKTSKIDLITDTVLGTTRTPEGTCIVYTSHKRKPVIRAALTVEQMEDLLG